ncbi:MAG TPA: histidine phosphatase family protein [Jatrophihabitans sp.]|jgi:probable phosphoglycerate mutase
MSKLVLLRHGRTAWNAERRFQGHADPPLDEVGKQQAYEVAGVVAALHPDLLVSSDAARAMQTAHRLAAATGLQVRIEPRLRERGLGHWEGLTRDEVAARHPDEYADWVAGRDVSRRGGETREQVAARALAAFADLPAVQTAVLVTHSATAMALCNGLVGLSQQLHVLGPLANCHWTELTTETTGHWRVRGHNLGVPGVVVPTPVHAEPGDEASDADA